MKVRLAVVSTGRQCTHALMPPIPSIDTIDLVAVCDLRRDLAERNARSFGAKAVYDDVARMLATERPDAVAVVGPPKMHEEVGLQVLAAGCHLFVEKPSSPTIAGAKRLSEAARKAGKIGQVGHMMRHADPVRIARQIAAAPEFGRTLAVKSRYTTWPTGAIADVGWGGADEDWAYMLVQGGHPIDLLRSFLGPIARVTALRNHGAGAAKVYQAILEATDGTLGFLDLQDSFDGWSTGLEIVGDAKGIVTVDDLGRVTYRRGEKRTPHEQERMAQTAYTWEPHHYVQAWQRSGYGPQLAHFADCILAGKPAAPSLDDAWMNLVIGQAILDSCRTRAPVEIAAPAAAAAAG